jgi:hypothetical protein
MEFGEVKIRVENFLVSKFLGFSVVFTGLGCTKPTFLFSGTRKVSTTICQLLSQWNGAMKSLGKMIR